MNDTITLKVPPYIREWITKKLGDPVRFPHRSPENDLLIHFLRKPPVSFGRGGKKTDICVKVCVPDNPYKRPAEYTYLTTRGRIEMCAAIDRLFRIHLWSECAQFINGKDKLNNGLDQWCKSNGISVVNREAVRQKFYRMRALYAERGIILGRKNLKK